MKRLNEGFTLTAFAIASLLGGCNSAVSSGRDSLIPSQALSALAHPTTSQDLLYISEYGGGVVDVFSYPQDVFLENLSGIEGTPQGECVDKKGDVFLIEAGGHPLIGEYAHGGTNPLTTLSDTGEFPYGCSIDPVTGDLAVSNEYNDQSLQGSVSVWHKAKGTPTTYVDPAIELVLWCGYDNKGNLFVDGIPPSGHSEFALVELPRGSKTFRTITVPKIRFGGNIQWDGSSLTIGDPAYKIGSAIYRVTISGTRATITGVTVLKKSVEVFGSWIEGGTVIGPDSGYGVSTVQLWKYPAGGKPTATLSKGTSGFFNGPFGAAVSPGSSHE